MDKNSDARLLEVHPKLAEKIRTLATMLAQEGIEVRVTQGFRTWAQQHALYIQGRAALPDVNACRLNCGLASIPSDQNRKVTAADAGLSWHNYGCIVFARGEPKAKEQPSDTTERMVRDPQTKQMVKATKDPNRECSSCGDSPVVVQTGMCAVCTWGTNW